MYHLVSDVIVKHSDGTYLLMQRDMNKIFGGMWEATAGGSALKGESALDCAKRELFEETGIYTDYLVELGRVTKDSYQTIFVEYMYITNCDKDSVVIQKGETRDYKWVTKLELLAMNKDELLTNRIQNYIPELRLNYEGNIETN